MTQGSQPGTLENYRGMMGREEAQEGKGICIIIADFLPGFQLVKNLLAMQETQVQSLGQEGPLEKEMATHFSILAWKIPWTEEPGRLCFMGLQESDMHDLATKPKHS